jgi:hypothetical protein
MVSLIRILVLIIAVAVFSPLRAQEETTDVFSLSRLSFSLSSVYHFQPWRQHNQAFSALYEQVKFDPYYGNPKGSYEKIVGDLSVEGVVGYAVMSGLSVNVGGRYTRTGGSCDLSHSLGSLPYQYAYNQTAKLDLFSFFVGSRYTISLTDILGITAYAYAERVNARFGFEYEYKYLGTQSVSSYNFSATLKEWVWSGTFGGGVSLKPFHPITLSLVAEYRVLRLSELVGSGIYKRSYGIASEYTFEAFLAEDENYFGIDIYRNTSPDAENDAYWEKSVLFILWSRIPGNSWGESLRPAVLDLTGFGIKLECSWQF